VEDGYDEFNAIAREFNELIPKEECIDFETYVNIDEHLSVLAPSNEHGLIEREVLENDLDIEEQSSDTPLIIDLKIINSHLQDFKLYALMENG
jgi:hypothetical protein